MAYSANNPPRVMTIVGLATGQSIWIYESADGHAVVSGANYFTNGGRLGMKPGDLLCSVNTFNSAVTWHRCTAVGALSFTSNGPATFSDAVFT